VCVSGREVGTLCASVREVGASVRVFEGRSVYNYLISFDSSPYNRETRLGTATNLAETCTSLSQRK